MAVIDNLQGDEATEYLQGYGLHVPHLIAIRRRRLKAYIECRVLTEAFSGGLAPTLFFSHRELREVFMYGLLLT